MPLYEYECERCKRRTEILQRFDDAPLTECAECGGTLRRLLSAPAVQFKGSGWYVTDYARKGGSGQKEEGKEKEKAEKKESKDKPEQKKASSSSSDD